MRCRTARRVEPHRREGLNPNTWKNVRGPLQNDETGIKILPSSTPAIPTQTASSQLTMETGQHGRLVRHWQRKCPSSHAGAPQAKRGAPWNVWRLRTPSDMDIGEVICGTSWKGKGRGTICKGEGGGKSECKSSNMSDDGQAHDAHHGEPIQGNYSFCGNWTSLFHPQTDFHIGHRALHTIVQLHIVTSDQFCNHK